MARSSLVLSAVLLAACASRPAPIVAPTPAPAPLRYATGSGRYRLESQSRVEQEMMGQSNVVDLSTKAMMTVDMAEDSGNLGVSITIDSLDVVLPAGVPGPDPAELAAARGQTVRLVSSRRGQTISLTPPDSASPTLRQVAMGLHQFLPQLPEGVPDSGTTWSDSASMTLPSQGIALTVHTTRVHRVVGWEDHQGTRALHLTTTSSYTLSGSGQSQGQEVDLNGAGRRLSDEFVSAAGVYLGGTLSDSSLVNANVISAGIVVPVRSKTRTTYVRLP